MEKNKNYWLRAHLKLELNRKSLDALRLELEKSRKQAMMRQFMYQFGIDEEDEVVTGYDDGYVEFRYTDPLNGKSHLLNAYLSYGNWFICHPYDRYISADGVGAGSGPEVLLDACMGLPGPINLPPQEK